VRLDLEALRVIGGRARLKGEPMSRVVATHKGRQSLTGNATLH